MDERDWEPDDEFLRDEGGVGIKAVDDVLTRYNLSLDRIITSRDLGVDMARYDLRRRKTPPGWQSWQLPLYLLPTKKATFFFIQVAQPGAVLPAHEHEVAQFRLIISGGLIYNGIELRGGDWIYTPAGPKGAYSLSVATNPAVPCVIHYAY